MLQSMSAPLVDNDLTAAQAGDRAAFGRLVDRYQDEVRACLAVRVASPADADDLAQEVFITAWRRLADVDAQRPFGAWLRGIALNLVRNHRRLRRHDALDLILEPAANDVAAADSSGLLAALDPCLERVDGPGRQLLHMRYGEDLPLADIAQRLGRNHSTLTMALHRLRDRLRVCIEDRLKRGLDAV